MLRFTALSLIALILTACGESKPQPGEIQLNKAFTLDFELVDHHGEIATDERFEGKPMLIYYGFTTCPDVCPRSLGIMTAALDELGRRADDVQPLFITVDPKRDDVERLRDHLAYDPRILGLTGDPEAAEAARSGMHVYVKEVPLPDSALGYTVDHQSMFFITDKSGTPVKAIRDDAAPEVIAKLVAQQFR